MPWENIEDKSAVIYAAHTTLGVRNMPLNKDIYTVIPIGNYYVSANSFRRHCNPLFSFSFNSSIEI